MNLGKLNEMLDDIGFRVTFADTDLVPKIEENGNPFRGEAFLLKWRSILDQGVEFHITLPQVCFVDNVVLTVGKAASVTCVQLRKDGQPIYRHCAQTGKSISGQSIHLQAGELCDSFSIVVNSDFAALELLSIDIYGAVEDGADLFPTPNAVTVGEEILPSHHFTAYCADSEDGLGAGRILAEKYAEKTGVTLQVKDSGNICFVTDPGICADGYKLLISREKTTISASNLRGFVYGAETFIKLTGREGVQTVTINDSPAKTFRGVHLFIPSEAQMDYARRLIKYVISPMGYNTVIMQVSGGLIYHSHPEISDAFAHAVEMNKQGLWPAFPHSGIAEGKPITRALLKEYLDYIRSFGIDVIPEVQSLGHVQYMTHAFPEIAEIPEDEKIDNVDTREEDMLPSQFYRHSYCPSNERSYALLFDILDEIIEVFQPKEYVHMGHDEVREIGVCKRCKGKDPAKLLAMDINRIYDHLKEKGLKMMIWADMLQPVTKYLTPPAIDMIPKDIVLLDFIWYFHMSKDIEDNLLQKDFQVIFGNVYSSHFPRYESRIRKEGVAGGQISAWTATSEYEMQKEGKIYDFIMTAQLLWADAYSKRFTLSYDRMISAMIPQLRDDLRGITSPSRIPGAKVTCIGENPISFPPVLPAQQNTLFRVGHPCSSLIFHHTQLRKVTREPWSQLDVAGKYILTYADGSTEEVDITSCGNIGYWNRRQNTPVAHRLYRHTGYISTYYADSTLTRTPDGEPVTVYRLEYIPKKAMPIESVQLTEDPAYDTKIFLQRLESVTL